MKKNFTLFTIALLLFSAMQAQMKKGDLQFGGSLGISQSSTKTDGVDKSVKTTSFSISPSIGSFYRDNRMMGIRLTYTNFRSDENDYNNNGFGAAFFLRQYKSLGKYWFIFLDEGISGQIINEKKNINIGRPKTQILQTFIGVYPGIVYAAGHHLQLEVSLTNLLALGYSSQKVNYPDNTNMADYTLNQFYLNTGLVGNNLTNLSFGMKWLLSAKK